MMRSARIVLRKWFVQEHAFLHRAYNALIDCFVITIQSLAFFTRTLERIASGWPNSQIADLMPWNFSR
jgi:hypothetical protein